MFMHPHAHILLFQYTCYIWTVWSFSNCLFLPLSLFSFTLVVYMASKHKSTPSQNPFHSGASSSSDSTPSHIRSRDEDARKDFSENYSWRGFHSERWVILSNFSNTNLPTVIHSRGWESLCDIPVTCPFVLISEFYSNMHGIDSFVPLFHTHVRGTRIVVIPQLVTNVLHVPRVELPNYPRCDCLRTVSKDEMISAFYERPLIEVTISLHHVRPLLKVIDS